MKYLPNGQPFDSELSRGVTTVNAEVDVHTASRIGLSLKIGLRVDQHGPHQNTILVEGVTGNSVIVYLDFGDLRAVRQTDRLRGNDGCIVGRLDVRGKRGCQR